MMQRQLPISQWTCGKSLWKAHVANLVIRVEVDKRKKFYIIYNIYFIAEKLNLNGAIEIERKVMVVVHLSAECVMSCP